MPTFDIILFCSYTYAKGKSASSLDRRWFIVFDGGTFVKCGQDFRIYELGDKKKSQVPDVTLHCDGRRKLAGEIAYLLVKQIIRKTRHSFRS